MSWLVPIGATTRPLPFDFRSCTSGPLARPKSKVSCPSRPSLRLRPRWTPPPPRGRMSLGRGSTPDARTPALGGFGDASSLVGGGRRISPDAASLSSAAAIGRAARAATEAHLVCFGSFAVATALAELRGAGGVAVGPPTASAAPPMATGVAMADDELPAASSGGEEADYEPGAPADDDEEADYEPGS